MVATIIKELIKWGVIMIIWLSYLPDLNLIKTVWNWIKDYIENKYGDI